MAISRPTANFTRPANATPYVSGQLVANSTTAGSVVPMTFLVTGNAHGPVFVRRVKIQKSTNSTANAQFRLHLYTTSPTVANGDGGTWSSTESGYLGSFDITVDKAFSDPASNGTGVPMSGTGTEVELPGGENTSVFGLLEARAAYTPGSAEVITVTLETYVGIVL